MNPHRNRNRVSHDRWLVSYADFITLLFAFFVVLYAFAKADVKKQQMVSEAINRAFRSLDAFPGEEQRNPLEGPEDVVLENTTSADTISIMRARDDLELVRKQLEESLAAQLAQHTVTLRMGREGLVVSLREAGFFPSGSAVPLPGSDRTLREVARSLKRLPFGIRIEGHTDNIPIHTAAFDSNWELSSARATSIARLFLSMHALPGERLCAAGYGEFHPVATNATATGRAENRRVDLVIMPESSVNFADLSATRLDGAWRKIDAP